MRFTRWTYWLALRRAKKAETLEFYKGTFGRSIPKRYMSGWEFTEALIRRKRREQNSMGEK